MTQTEPDLKEDVYRKTAEYRDAEAFLVGRIDYERVTKMPYSRRKLNLRRMSRFLDLLDNPHDQIDIIHVAGTKGKGSTVAFLTAALKAQGLRCGSYTSPHLHQVEERFRLQGQPCRPQDFVKLIRQVRPVVEQLDAEGPDYQVTYFEIATALGFLYFVYEQADVAIVEVGLGGRLDSTNVCMPLVSVITSISLDHTKQLGSTAARIAAEKGGIIKPRVPVVSGVISPEPRDVIRNIAQHRNAKLVERDRDFRFSNYVAGSWDEPSSVTFEQFIDGDWQTAISEVQLGCHGQHQAANACVAWAALSLLSGKLRPHHVALRRGFESARCEGRIEVLGRNPLVIIDAAHNAASAKALAETLTESPTRGARWLILATTRGKDVRGILEHLLPQFDHVICTRYEKNPRSHAVDQLLTMVNEVVQACSLSIRVTRRDRPIEAWKFTQASARPDDCICITGSFFIAAELREILTADDS